MSRKKTLEGGTRDKILDAALQVFMENGYENTSVRTILAKAGVVTGSFYHFFSSKEELFEAVIGQYLQQYAQNIAEIVDKEDSSVFTKLELILNIAEESTGFYYQKLEADKLHWTIQYALHKKTMMAILPAVEKLVNNAISNGIVTNPLQLDNCTLASLLLQGMEGIIHAKPVDTMDEEQIKKIRADIIAYVTMILGV